MAYDHEMKVDALPTRLPGWKVIHEWLLSSDENEVTVRLADSKLLKLSTSGHLQSFILEIEGVEIPRILLKWSGVVVTSGDGLTRIAPSRGLALAQIEQIYLVAQAAVPMVTSKQPYLLCLKQSLTSSRSALALKEVNENVLLGLLGELLVFDGVRRAKGFSSAMKSWKSRENLLHDFSFEHDDVEVKTTARNDRIHVIGSLNQLEARTDRGLKLLSIHLVETSPSERESFSLASMYEYLKSAFDASSKTLASDFEERVGKALNQISLDVDDLGEFGNTRYAHKSAMKIFSIDKNFPRITPSSLNLSKGAAGLLSQVSYSIDVSKMKGTSVSQKELGEL